ncbi:PREDICTED: regulator of G-protein signaling 1 isoform X1 [Myotis brandtii]|uniref:regulator of G-protein signaling 1 isoform X1 n=1 Tax=Myotis brandtii TaxID=109478 RepID=UPI0003BBD589|nr:PREDICTED: regulator of G-protein signaling 1 isoform X1 [Myotis brandtii]
MRTMRGAAIPAPRLHKMPGMLFSAPPKELQGTDHSLLDDKTQKRRPKTFGMDVKAYLRSMIPHLESGMKPSRSKDILSADEVLQWSQSLEKLLANRAGQDVFGSFLKSEFSEENIEFWLACEDYKRTESDLLHGKAEKIYKSFVHSDAAKQINIDFHTRESTAKKIKAPTPTCFDEAQKIVYTLMEKDSYPRFLKSNIYLNLLNDLQANSLK